MDNEEIYLNILNPGKYPHLDKLMDFISEPEQLTSNLTACAYFSNILTSLLKAYPDQIMTYIYSKGEILSFLIENADI